MRKAFMIVWIIVLVIAAIAVFTKPSYQQTFYKISHELNSRGYLAGAYYKYDSINHHTDARAQTPVVIKDRLFYRDIFFPINGKVQRIAIAAFGRLFLID